ncbi:hypothetical protein GMSM_21330 [Geomonas sp. Red276]
MFRKLMVVICLITFIPAAAGAQELGRLASQQPGAQTAAAAAPRTSSVPSPEKAAAQVAANECTDPATGATEVKESRHSHSGMTFRDFVDVHFGEYRWIYWVGAAGVLVALHVFAFGKD